MSNFEKITASPEALAEFLAKLPVADSPRDASFHERFCGSCERADCGVDGCPHYDERYNPLWWLKLGHDSSAGPEEELPVR